MISARILKTDEGPHLSPGGVVHGAALYAMAEPLQCGGGLLQTVCVFDLEPDGLVGRMPFVGVYMLALLILLMFPGLACARAALGWRAVLCRPLMIVFRRSMGCRDQLDGTEFLDSS